MNINICLECWQYIFNKVTNESYSIKEADMFARLVETSYPSAKFKIKLIQNGPTWWNNECKECDTCKSTEQEQRFTVTAERVN